MAAGTTGGGPVGTRKSTAYCLDRHDGGVLRGNGQGGGLCWGDSGGPVMGDGTNEIWGVLSGFEAASGDCKVGDRMVWVPVVDELPFIQSALAAPIDAFTTGTDGWRSISQPGYQLGVSQGIAVLYGNAHAAPNVRAAAMWKAFTVRPGTLRLSFYWRAISAAEGANNAQLELFDGTGKLLHSAPLVRGGARDSGWQLFMRDLSAYVKTTSVVQLVISFQDPWSQNFGQTLWVDHAQLYSPQTAL
jgi:hypothetical protein